MAATMRHTIIELKCATNRNCTKTQNKLIASPNRRKSKNSHRHLWQPSHGFMAWNIRNEYHLNSPNRNAMTMQQILNILLSNHLRSFSRWNGETKRPVQFHLRFYLLNRNEIIEMLCDVSLLCMTVSKQHTHTHLTRKTIKYFNKFVHRLIDSNNGLFCENFSFLNRKTKRTTTTTPANLLLFIIIIILFVLISLKCWVCVCARDLWMYGMPSDSAIIFHRSCLLINAPQNCLVNVFLESYLNFYMKIEGKKGSFAHTFVCVFETTAAPKWRRRRSTDYYFHECVFILWWLRLNWGENATKFYF